MTLILLAVILAFGVNAVNAQLLQNKLGVKPAENQISVSGVSRENEQNIYIQAKRTSLSLDKDLTHSTAIINYYDNWANGTKPLVSEYCKKPFNRSIFPNIFHPQMLTDTERELLIDTIYGFNVYVDSLDATVSKTIANSGTWEPHMISLIATLVKPGDSILNIGSHIGLEAIIMGKIIGQHGRLFAVQPYSFSYSLLKKNIRMNGLNNISQIYQVGASDKAGKGLITVSIGNTGASQIRQDKTKNMEEAPKLSKFNHKMQLIEQVSLIQIDQLLPKQAVLDFALIDVQKMQVPVLIGMKSMILRSPDLVIMVEWQYGSYKKASRQQTQELLKFMLDNGYRVYRYVKNSLDHQKECEIGKFVEFRKAETLFHIIISEIFFFPKHKAP